MNIIYDPKDFWILLFNFKLKHHKKKKKHYWSYPKSEKNFHSKIWKESP